MSEDNNLPTNNGVRANLPARLPSASLVLNRTRTTLGVLRDVVQESSGKHWYEQGKKAIAEANWAGAIHSFEYALNISPTHWQCELQLAYVFAEQELADYAATYLQKAYKGPVPHFRMFSGELTLMQWGCLERIICNNQESKSNEQLLALALAHYGAMISKGHLQGDGGKSRIVLDKALDMQDDLSHNTFLFNRLSSCLWLCQRQLQKALLDVKRALELNTKDAYSYFTLGCIELEMNHFEDAVDAFSKAISIIKSELYYYGHRSNALQKLRRYDEALTDIESMIKIEPNSYSAHDGRLEINKILQNWKDVIEDADWLINLTEAKHPKIFTIYLKDRAYAKELLGDISGAAEDYQEVQRRQHPLDSKAHEEGAPF